MKTQWIETDEHVINLQQVVALQIYSHKSNHHVVCFEGNNSEFYNKTFTAQQQRDEYFTALKKLLDVLE